MQDRQVTVKIGGRHPLGSALLGITLQFMVSKREDAYRGGAFAPRSLYGQEDLSLGDGKHQHMSIYRSCEHLSRLCRGLASMLIHPGFGTRLFRGHFERGRGTNGQRVLPMQSNHGMATGLRWRSGGNSTWIQSCAKETFLQPCRSAAHHRKRTNNDRCGISNTEIICAHEDAYTEGLGPKKRGRTVETGAVLFLHYIKATPDC
ncbi:uncharacterized protein B0J16DRAFT_181475 [Fusarium flagelliforme]|uniref:uncharacterized protein n=1 Tax=Fusarium flagelliforme TaxID=2675880 RepID=UPI001E8DA05C|nr:uncharacterized protein B0J16DRAFT_181475 [Fusarium flagelliforme]KAH7174345.1 hypothetical protein B0J16DRAFT_181475 [Fusarium flagelliforme]